MYICRTWTGCQWYDCSSPLLISLLPTGI